MGAQSELELRSRVSRGVDAVRAAQTALRDGLLPGGGAALVQVTASLVSSVVTTEAVVHYL